MPRFVGLVVSIVNPDLILHCIRITGVGIAKHGVGLSWDNGGIQICGPKWFGMLPGHTSLHWLLHCYIALVPLYKSRNCYFPRPFALAHQTTVTHCQDTAASLSVCENTWGCVKRPEFGLPKKTTVHHEQHWKYWTTLSVFKTFRMLKLNPSMVGRGTNVFTVEGMRQHLLAHVATDLLLSHAGSKWW